MTTQTLPRSSGYRAQRAAKALGIAVHAVIGVVRANSRPIRTHIGQHGYTLVGFGCISGASFLHSTFTGLLVTGILFLIFEGKVSE